MKSVAITDAERVVMEALWGEAPLGSAEIVERVAIHQDWAPKTVQTLIHRLVQKNAIAREPAGRGYLYRPALGREEFVRDESRSLIQRLFGGRVTPLVAAFTERERISADDLAELRKLVNELERKHGPGDSDDHDH